jgi:hypothetical protein
MLTVLGGLAEFPRRRIGKVAVRDYFCAPPVPMRGETTVSGNLEYK